MGGDIFARQMNDRIDVVQLIGVDRAGQRIPADFEFAFVDRPPYYPAHQVPVGLQSADQCGADQAG